MKKKNLIFILLSFCVFSFAQSAVDKANRRTAERCLKLAENCLVAGDWDNAVKQASLGLSYDDTVSDLYYVKAASESNMGKTKAVVLETIIKAFELNNWIGYSKSGARILYSDLLCDTGHYEKSLQVIDEEPFIYSADAEYIRIKNYYRIGSEKTLDMARLKINTTRRIYPDDERFPDIFFLFESSFKNMAEETGISYEIPELVKTISNSYILHLPDYSARNSERELLASYLAEEDVRNRLVSSVMSREKSVSPLMAVAAKNAGIYSDLEACTNFFDSCGDTVSYELLKLLISKISDGEAKAYVADRLNKFDGYLLVDDNLDYQNEMNIKYDCGRPLFFSYDKNSDGVEDIHGICDLGSPVSIYCVPDNIEIFYEYYPHVVRINYLKENINYDFIRGDFIFNPFEVLQDNLCSNIGADFYIPFANENVVLPDSYEILKKASAISLKTEEREDSRVVYYSHEGQLSYADFYEGNEKYASCNFEEGYPFTRYVNYNRDELFETVEIFDLIPLSVLESDSVGLIEEDKEYIHRIFGNIFDNQKIYLKKVQIDRNGNTNPEFSEEYLENDGKINLWDYDDNGVWDNQYIRYPTLKNNDVVEETIFFDDIGIASVSVISINKVPARIKYRNEEIDIHSGTKENFYWIGDTSISVTEKDVLEELHGGLEQGKVEIVQVKNNRFTIVKVNANYYCRFIDTVSEAPVINGETETSDELEKE